MSIPVHGPASQSELDAARLLLAKLGVSPADLLQVAAPRSPAPTFAEYVPVVSAAVGAGARKTYGTYWNRLLEAWPDRRIDEPTPSELKQMATHVRSQVLVRRNARGGHCAAEHFVSAVRCLYKHAIDDGLIAESDNPARKVSKPRRLTSSRQALPDTGLVEINHVAATTGTDPELDSLLLRLHTETACRRGGALALRPCDLDPDQCLIRLREKGDTVRWQPVSPTPMAHAQRHAEARCSPPNGQLLRCRSGVPVTRRHYDSLWARIGRHLPWVAAQQISAHWLRHTTLTWVERNFGYAVARAFAGHTDGGKEAGATATYVRATIREVAAAVAALTGEAHPLA